MFCGAAGDSGGRVRGYGLGVEDKKEEKLKREKGIGIENKGQTKTYITRHHFKRKKDNNKTKDTMEAVIERMPGWVTVSMSARRWNRMLQLEEAYKLARTIKRSMKQVETEPSMTPEEAIEQLRSL